MRATNRRLRERVAGRAKHKECAVDLSWLTGAQLAELEQLMKEEALGCKKFWPELALRKSTDDGDPNSTSGHV